MILRHWSLLGFKSNMEYLELWKACPLSLQDSKKKVFFRVFERKNSLAGLQTIPTCMPFSFHFANLLSFVIPSLLQDHTRYLRMWLKERRNERLDATKRYWESLATIFHHYICWRPRELFSLWKAYVDVTTLIFLWPPIELIWIIQWKFFSIKFHVKHLERVSKW